MRTLDRKVLRETWRQRGQAVAVALVVGCGIASFVTMRSAYDALVMSQRGYYQAQRFADLFAHVTRAPEETGRRVAALPGVAVAETRLVFESTLDVPGLAEPATGHIVSLPRELNLLHLRKGRLPAAGATREVAVSEAFSVANRIDPGGSLSAVLNGRWTRLDVVGVALSPEFVYELPAGSLFPDNRRYGVLWMSREAMEAAFDMRGAFNDLLARLAPGVLEADVLRKVDSILDRYGTLGAYGRADQISHRFLTDEIRQDRITGIVVPGVFLAIAAFLTHVILSRMIATQREQIAVLKAYGYTNLEIGTHYLKLALFPVGAGSIAGVAAGVWLGRGLARIYADFFRFPEMQFSLSTEIVLTAAGIGAATAISGVWVAVRNVIALPPAEAMKPARPASFQAGILERLRLTDAFPVAVRMILRSLERQPVRALLTLAGLSFAVATLLTARYFTDGIDYLLHVQFDLVQRASATVVFRQPLTARAAHELRAMPGVLRVEGFRSVPVRLRAGHRSYRTGIQGLPSGGNLLAILDTDLNRIEIPPRGLVMSSYLAKVLDVVPGDEIRVEVLEGSKAVRTETIGGVTEEFLGTSVYMDLDGIHRMLGEESALSGALLSVDPKDAAALYARLKNAPAVAGVQAWEAAIAGFLETLAKSMSISTGILTVFALVIACSIVYNSVRIAMSERAHELASLRVLGFTRGEVALILLGEQAMLTVASIPCGFVLGWWICALMARAMASELFRMPVILFRASYVNAAEVILVASVLSGVMIAHGVWRLNLLQALKTRE